MARYNSQIVEHVVAAKTEELLARFVQGFEDEQVVRWGAPIGSHGADVISVSTKTGQVTLWDAKFRTAGVAIQNPNVCAWFGRSCKCNRPSGRGHQDEHGIVTEHSGAGAHEFTKRRHKH